MKMRLLIATLFGIIGGMAWSDSLWFREAQYGLFVHWGCYSVPASGEWYLNSSQIDPEKYAQFADQFKAEKFDAKDWVEKVKRWNMKYVVFTTRHHDGYAMWDSKVNPFNCMRRGPKRDILGELVKALRENGIKVGFYYSPANWSHPDYAGYKVRGWPSYENWKDEASRKSFVAYYKAELEELLTKYGAPDYLWWDGCLPGGLEGDSLLAELRRKYPNTIWNDRMGKPYDVRTCEQEIRPTDGVPWEACMTLNENWGYNANDKNWKRPESVIDMLLSCARDRGNLLLNVGPKPDGTIPAPSVEVLDQVGAFLGRIGVREALSVYADAVANVGDERGLRRVFDKVERGEEVRIAVMGGSITEGAGASSGNSRWGDVFNRGWRELFPKGNFKFANFGIGATGSDIGAFRYSGEVSPFKPDLIVFEYSVNDNGSSTAAETMQGVVRHAMREGASVMMLGMCSSNGSSAQEAHLKVARNYKVPFVSYRDAVMPRIRTGQWKWNSIGYDGVHPNTFGHALTGELLNLFVRDSLRRYRLDRDSKPSVPEVVITKPFERGSLVPFASVKLAESKGFAPASESYWGEGLFATNAGARLSFECEGSIIGLVHSRGKKYSGAIKVTVDGVECKEHSSAFGNNDWWYTPSVIVHRGKIGRHRVEMEVVADEKRPTAPIAFKLCALLVDGSVDIETRRNGDNEKRK